MNGSLGHAEASQRPQRSIVLVDADSRRLRRVEFVLRMAGYFVVTMPNDQEAGNWLLSQAENKVSALVLMSPYSCDQIGALAEIVPVKISIPVLFVAADNRLDSSAYVDLAYGGKSWCIKTTEFFLLEALEKILKLQTPNQVLAGTAMP